MTCFINYRVLFHYLSREMESDSDYRVFSPSEDRDELTQPPPRYQTRNPDREARSQARAEARRTRRTMRQQQQQQQTRQLPTEKSDRSQHYKIDVDSDSSDTSSIDENYDVASLTESIHENLT